MTLLKMTGERPKPEFDFRLKAEISVHCQNRNSAETEISVKTQFLANTD
jgi:hypothetical protein